MTGKHVRVSTLARKPGTPEYRAAVREFVGKMGGPINVMSVICSLELEKSRQSLFPEEFPSGQDMIPMELVEGGVKPSFRSEETLARAM